MGHPTHSLTCYRQHRHPHPGRPPDTMPLPCTRHPGGQWIRVPGRLRDRLPRPRHPALHHSSSFSQAQRLRRTSSPHPQGGVLRLLRRRLDRPGHHPSSQRPRTLLQHTPPTSVPWLSLSHGVYSSVPPGDPSVSYVLNEYMSLQHHHASPIIRWTRTLV